MDSKPIALVGGTMIDGTGRDPVNNSVLITDGKCISKVGTTETVKIPEGCEVIDIRGKTVMPGLIDMHVHLGFDEVDMGSLYMPSHIYKPLPWYGIISYVNARKNFEMGFTTLRDCGEVIGEYSTLALRDVINAGILRGPRLFVSGPWLTTTCGHNGSTLPLWISRNDIISQWCVDGPDECLKATRERIKMGVDFIKVFGTGGIMNSYNQQEFNEEELKAIVDEAHSKGLPVSGHLEYPDGMIACLNAGFDTMEHGWVLTEEVIRLMIEKGTVLMPTISVVWNIVNRGDELRLPKAYIETTKNTIYDKAMKSFKMAYEAGVTIATGSDCGFFTCAHGTNAQELEMMVKCCGMTEMEAIVASTKTGAETLGMGSRFGTLEAEKLADVIVVDGNPLADITVLQKKENILMVMKEGFIDVKRGAYE